MTSCKPYLVRALYDWILDNQCTPYILVDAEYPMVQVPREYVKQGQIVLNVAPQSTGNFVIGDDEIEFNARFGGQARHLIIPIEAVLFIYSKETGEGMPFPPEQHPEVTEEPLDSEELVDLEPTTTVSEAKKPSLSPVEASETAKPSSDKPKDKKSRNHLKVIK
ncbi:ClpXP protease specificity-enhancing factor [Catenovulum sp. SM1970]|nr:ClpXP protease specificity-enhancing factor [Marinifaba aquimaris]